MSGYLPCAECEYPWGRKCGQACAYDPNDRFLPSSKITKTMPKESQKFDVVIYAIESRKVHTIAGSDLRKSGSFHTVDKRLALTRERLNDAFGAKAVPAGKFKVGDVLPD